MKSVIRNIFKDDRSKLIHSLPRVENSWGAELQNLEGHSGSVNSVVFSPDGQRAVSSSSDRTIKLWDVTTGSAVQSLEGHSDPVNLVTFSPNGQRVASGSSDGTVKLWDVTTGLDCSQASQKSGFRISVDADWVTFRGGKVLWLPRDYRGPTCFAIKDDTLSLGYHDGRVSILGFCAFEG